MPWPESLLVVDDQAEVRGSVIAMMADLGIAPPVVLEARDAEEAIALYDRHHPQLTLVDVVLFGNSGFDVLRHIRQKDEEAVVMMMTAFPQFDYAMEAIRARVDHFLVKPLTRDQLEGALMDVLRHRSRRGGGMPSAHSFYMHQLDRVLRGEEPLSSLEKARREAGIDALPGEEMLFALITGPQSITAEALIKGFEALGGRCVAYARGPGEWVLITAFAARHREHTAQLLGRVLQENMPGFVAGWSVALRETGLMEMHRRAAFSLAYSRERHITGMNARYERLDLGRILVTRCHGALMSAYDSGEEARLVDALDEWMIQLRQHNAMGLAAPALNEMFSIEGLPPLAPVERPEERLYPEVMAHFQKRRAVAACPPPALRLSAIRRYLLESPGCLLNREALSSLTTLSYGYLSELFRQHMGQSLNEYARALRLRQAAELLSGTSCRVYEVARLTGFEGNKHFYGIFQNAYGQTPVQYHETRYCEMERAT